MCVKERKSAAPGHVRVPHSGSPAAAPPTCIGHVHSAEVSDSDPQVYMLYASRQSAHSFSARTSGLALLPARDCRLNVQGLCVSRGYGTLC